MRSVRLWYEKSGRATYISHLDMNRSMTKALRRAKLPIWYTEGFNPHPYMTFLLPLPLGQAGMREPMDIRVIAEMSNPEIQNRLQAVMPEGIAIVDVTDPVQPAKAIAAAQYQIEFDCASQQQAADFAQRAQVLLQGGALLAEKKTKRGQKIVNLCEMIHTHQWTVQDTAVHCTAILAAGSTRNLNAALLAQTLQDAAVQPTLRFRIVRTKLLDADHIVFA